MRAANAADAEKARVAAEVMRLAAAAAARKAAELEARVEELTQASGDSMPSHCHVTATSLTRH